MFLQSLQFMTLRTCLIIGFWGGCIGEVDEDNSGAAASYGENLQIYIFVGLVENGFISLLFRNIFLIYLLLYIYFIFSPNKFTSSS
jgi:hypothetical protein